MTDHARPRADGCSSFHPPAGLTLAGRRAFDQLVQDYAGQLVEQLAQQSRSRHRPDAVHTTHDVLDAKLAVEQRLRQQQEAAGGAYRLAMLLLWVAAGIALLTPYATGFTQAALLGLFVATETAGLLLVRRSRRSADEG